MDETEIKNEWKQKYDVLTGTLKEKLSDSAYNFALSNPEKTDELIEDKLREMLGKTFVDIMRVLHRYSDIPPIYYKIVALWIIGTYIHDEFETFPLLFINATKGSGKSRLLKLIIALSRNGKIILDLKEAPLFRTAKGSTLGIDEFENVGSKDNSTIRTLINAAYKKGAKVERMKKVSDKGQEKQVVESFDLFCSVVMANIWGMDEVVADRCLQVVLDKSDNPIITKLIEDFQTNPDIILIKRTLEAIQCSLCSVVTKKNIVNHWNNYIILKYQTTLTTYNTYNTLTTLTTPLTTEQEQIFNRIDNTKIDGRNLELFFPLFIISSVISDELFNEILALSETIIKDKKHEEYTESKDVSLVDFVSGKWEYEKEWVSVVELAKQFRYFISAEEDEIKWMNPRWMGRALKRNKLISQKRRMGKGIEVLLDVQKAVSKLRVFREDLDKENKQ